MTALRWERVEELVDASPSLADLRAHGLQLIAARQWRSRGEMLPDSLVQEELQSIWRTQAAPRVLQAVRDAWHGPFMLVKGPAVAAGFPDPITRPFIDIDLLFPDAPAAQAALLRSGFRMSCEPGTYPDGTHHLPPIHSPEHPIAIEVHSRLKWVAGLPDPSWEMLADGAETGALGVEGVLAPRPAQHALVLAGHLWAHDPLARLLRILDIAVMADASDRDELEALARAWGIERMWRSTAAITDALLGDRARDPWPLRTWARGLRATREMSVLEVHLSRMLSPFAIHPPAAAVRALAPAVAKLVRPQAGEPWRRKLARTAQQVAKPSMRRSEHVEATRADRFSRRD